MPTAEFHIPDPKHEAEKAIDKIIKPAITAGEHAVNTVKDEAVKAVKDARAHGEWGVNHVRKEAEGALATVETDAKKAIADAGHAAVDTFHDAVDEAKKDVAAAADRFADHAEEAVSHAMTALAKAVTEHGLSIVKDVVATTHDKLEALAKSKPGLVDAINQLGGKVEIGPLKLAYSNFYTRTELVAGVLDQYINEPPELRRGPIIDMVRALGPDSIDLGISVQVVALVVGSKELGVGGGLNDVSIDLFAEIGDVILEKMGVPE